MQLWPVAYKKLKIQVTSAAEQRTQAQAMKDDPDVIQENHYQALQGIRFSYLESRMTEATLEMVTTLSIVQEGTRYLTGWWMRRAAMKRRARRQCKGKLPDVCDLVCVQTSPIVRVLQYFSELASGDAPRLQLLYGRSHPSFEAWARSRPDALARLRRTLKTASAWLQYRHVRRVMCMPWLAAAVVDSRRSDNERRGIAREIKCLEREQLDQWFGLELQARLQALPGNGEE